MPATVDLSCPLPTEVERIADDLEKGGISPGQVQRVGPECIVGDIDVGDLDVRGGRGVLGD